MEKSHLERRLAQLEAEGIEFRCNINAGVDITGDQLREQFDAVVLAGGATAARDLAIPGREFVGIHQAMEFLPLANRVQEGDLDRSPIHAEGKRVVIIGGGMGGLSASGRLARDGYDVTLLEKNASVGGRAGSWEKDGFRFDTGPSWYLMPEVFDHFFRLMGTSAEEHYQLLRLDPGYRVFFEEDVRAGTPPLDIRDSREANLDLFEQREPGSREKMSAYLDSAKDTYEVAKRRFLYTSFAKFGPLVRADVLKRLPKLLSLLRVSLADFAARYVSSPTLQQVLGYPAVFLGSSPYITPSMYHLMSYLDLEDGVLYAEGGFHRVIQTIEKLARDEGVTIITKAPVTRSRQHAASAAARPSCPRCASTSTFKTAPSVS
jgi:phytoene desaturase